MATCKQCGNWFGDGGHRRREGLCVECAGTKEGDIRTLLKKRVGAYGGEVRAVSWLGRKNAPDVLCLFPHDSLFRDRLKPNGLAGLHPFVECKRPKEDATAAQAREHERMRAAGCVVLMVRNVSELDAWLPPL